MKRYNNYIFSGYDWMGQIPSHWLLTKNRYGFKKIDNGFNQSEDTPVLSLTTKGIKVKIDLNFGKSSESYIGHQLVKKGDIVFTPRDFDQTPILSDVSDFDGCISNLYIVDKTKENVLNHYVNYYWYGLKYSCDYFKIFSHGMRYSFNRFQFDEIPLLIPPFPEQEQIVKYLDEKTSQIDGLISITEKKIELLKQKRTSLINEVVTKGLNPDVEMKDSGVEWIGEIPVHWELRKGSTIGNYSKGNGIKKDEVKEVGFPCIRYGEIYTTYDVKFDKTVSFIDENTMYQSIRVTKGTLLLTGSGETLEDIGKCVVYTGNEEVFVGGDIIILKPHYDIFSEFLSYQINSECIRVQREQSGKGGIIVHIYSKSFRDMRFPIPPLSEQEQIVEYIDTHTTEIDKLVSIEQRRIETLKEYRQSLISEVVTGKINVTKN